jgi:hypothetical protein
MSPLVVIILIIVVLVVIAAIVYGVQASRRKQLQNTFGPEYDRVVADTGSRSDGEKELREREKRHAELELKPLSAESKATYSAAWEEMQVEFVDNPAEAVTTADDLVTRLIAECGYPTDNYDDQLADLSVDHARTLGHYRDAHAISRRSADGGASTEDLRQALMHYRALFADLLGNDPLTTSPSATANAVTSRTDEPAASADEPAASADEPAAKTPTKPSTTAPTQSAKPDHDTDVAGSRPDATSS